MKYFVPIFTTAWSPAMIPPINAPRKPPKKGRGDRSLKEKSKTNQLDTIPLHGANTCIEKTFQVFIKSQTCDLKCPIDLKRKERKGKERKKRGNKILCCNEICMYQRNVMIHTCTHVAQKSSRLQFFSTYEHLMQRAFTTKKNCQADGGVVMSAGDRPASIHSGHQSESD